MSEQITRAHLATARAENLVRLARALRLHGCACGAAKCHGEIIERVVRELERLSMSRHVKTTGAERSAKP